MTPIRSACRRFLAASFTLCAVVAPLLAFASTAMAQDPTDPPSPTLRTGGSIMVSYLIMFVLLVAVVVVSLIPSKRSHQD